MKKTELVQGPSPEIYGELEKIDVILNKTGYRIRFQTMNNLDPRILLRELDNTYKIVVDTYLKC